MNKIQIVRLKNGDELIANVSVTGTNYLLEEPMLFMLDGRGHRGQLMMQHYLPVQLLKRNEINISLSEIFAVMEPDDEFAEFYQHQIYKINILMKAKNDLSNDEEMNMESILESYEAHIDSGHTVH
jgi:hypothetical protein